MMGKTMLWGALGEEERRSIVSLCKERSFEARDKIVKKGDKGTGFYLILEGSVEIKTSNNTLAKLGTGQFFGEMSLLDGEPRSADAVASGATRCLVLNEKELNEIIDSNPKIARVMLRELSHRLRATTQSIRD